MVREYSQPGVQGEHSRHGAPAEDAQPNDSPSITVIIPVFDDADGLRQCLEALERQTMPRARFEAIVVDNGSKTSAASLVAQFSFAKYCFEPKKGSYAARNAGIRQASAPLLAFTDSDCRPQPNWLEEASAFFDREASVDAAGGQVELSVSTRRSVAELHELLLPPIPQKHLVECAGFAATANLIVRAPVFQSVGPFNEDLLSAGDWEWGSRLTAGGHTLHYLPHCSVIHPARTSVRSLIQRRRRVEGGRLHLARVDGASGYRSSAIRPYPPRALLAYMLFAHPRRLGLQRIEGMKVLLLGGLLVAVRILENVRLRFGGTPER